MTTMVGLWVSETARRTPEMRKQARSFKMCPYRESGTEATMLS